MPMDGQLHIGFHREKYSRLTLALKNAIKEQSNAIHKSRQAQCLFIPLARNETFEWKMKSLRAPLSNRITGPSI